MTLLDRFLRYVQIDTQSDEHSNAAPSTEKQLDLSRLLVDECRAMGLSDVSMGETGVVIATVPASGSSSAPAIAWIAHVDTSPETSGRNVKPQVHSSYDGNAITMPGDPSRVLTPEDQPALTGLVGQTIITSDGTTLLGGDDKAGVAVIMDAAQRLISTPDLEHGPVRLCFTCDEEIGRGTNGLSLDDLNAVCGYTLDGDGAGKIDSETFSADLAVVTVTGVNTHPSVGYGRMVNAIRILSAFIDRLPQDHSSPETTRGRDGFLHPYQIEGGVAEATARILLRDFESTKLEEFATLLESIADQIGQEFPEASIEIEVSEQYRNMREGLEREPRAVAKAVDAMQALGIDPELNVIRGGTDGSLLTAMGLPTPNLATGQHNPHSPLEWSCLEEMETAVDVLFQLALAWGSEKE